MRDFFEWESPLCCSTHLCHSGCLLSAPSMCLSIFQLQPSFLPQFLLALEIQETPTLKPAKDQRPGENVPKYRRVGLTLQDARSAVSREERILHQPTEGGFDCHSQGDKICRILTFSRQKGAQRDSSSVFLLWTVANRDSVKVIKLSLISQKSCQVCSLAVQSL